MRKNKKTKNLLPSRYVTENFELVNGNAIEYLDLIENNQITKTNKRKVLTQAVEANESNKYEQLEGYSKSRRSLTMPSSSNVISMGYQKKVDIDEVIGSLPSNPPAKKRLKQKFLLIIINNFN